MATTPDRALLTPLPGFGGRGDVSVSMLRLELLHPVVSGNKWFKLAPNLAAAKAQGFDAVLTFGGAYSNHLVATAAACAEAGMKSVGIVRGLHGVAQETPTLQQCRAFGMQLHFLSREDYARKGEPDFQAEMQTRFDPAFIIPEGGANEWGRKGAEWIAAMIPEATTQVCVAVGTGTTFTGLRNVLPVSTKVTGFTAMKGGEYLMDEIRPFLSRTKAACCSLQTAYSFGGFAKCPPALHGFMRDFQAQFDIELDRVYTAKMMAGLDEMIRQGVFPTGSRIVAVHTGGLQGNKVIKGGPMRD